MKNRQGLQTAIRRRNNRGGADDGRSAKTSLNNARVAVGNLVMPGGGKDAASNSKQLNPDTARMAMTSNYEEVQYPEAPGIEVANYRDNKEGMPDEYAEE